MKKERETWTYLVSERRRAQDWSLTELIEDLEVELERKIGMLEDEDHEGLVAYLEKIVARRPDDAYALKDLGEAYVLKGEPEKALELLAPLHRRAPHFEDPQWVILDALFALGRDEVSFDWLEQPTVVRLDARVLASCQSYLRRRGRPTDVRDIYSELLCEGYCAFTERELLEALRRDGRFEVGDGEDWPAVTVRELGERARNGQS